jgi:beta-lactamase class A
VMKTLHWIVLIGLFAGTPAILTAAEATLESVLKPLVDAHKGKVAIAVKHLDTGVSYNLNATEPMPTASLIKLAVMIETYFQAADHKIDLAKTITLKKADKVPGSGILTYHFSEGTTFPLVDAVHLMIVYSDNTATNLVLDQIGLDSTAKRMESLGMPNTKIHSKVYRRDTSIFPDRSKKFGLGSTTAADMIALCEKLHKKELISKEACEAMLEHLKACDDKDKFPRFLPPGVKVAFKTGSVDEIRTAAGILYTPAGPIALCVLTKDNEDKRYAPDNAGNRLCAQVARSVYDYFNPPKPDKKAGEGKADAAKPADRSPPVDAAKTPAAYVPAFKTGPTIAAATHRPDSNRGRSDTAESNTPNSVAPKTSRFEADRSSR